MNGMKRCWIGKATVALSALTLLATSGGVRAQNGSTMDDSKMMESGMSMSGNKNAQMLIQTRSEELTEIKQLAAHQAALQKMGGRENMRLVGLMGRMIRDHKAADPRVVRAIRANGGDPMQAKVLKAPVMGDKMKMLHADMVDHMKAETTSQMRYGMTSDRTVKTLMKARAGIARKHMAWMKPYHSEKNCPMCADMMKNMKMGGSMKMGGGDKMGNAKMSMMCPHCNVKMMKDGKCPMCGMTAAQMKKS